MAMLHDNLKSMALAVVPTAVSIAILAKAPVPGIAKTRLTCVLGAGGAANLQARFIRHTVQTAKTAGIGPVTLWGTPDRHRQTIEAIAGPLGVRVAEQPDGDLGDRMLAAIAAAPGPAIVTGTDCPALIAEHLRVAAAVLRDGVDVVIIPVEDGGYGLIGMRRPVPAVFTGMTWSSDLVMVETRRRLMRLGLSWREPARLWDVDLPADLERLTREGLTDLMA
jgi:rSAM/selenodomain-associated transferase 1